MNAKHVLQQIDAYLALYPQDAEATLSVREQAIREPAGLLQRSTMLGHVTSSMLVLSQDLTQILLIHHRALGLWIQPGGHAEPYLTLIENAVKEVLEETGIVVRILAAHPLDIDTHDIPANPAKGEGAHRHHDFLYGGIADGDYPIKPEETEVFASRWAPAQEVIQKGGRLGRAAERAIAIALRR